MKRGLMCLLAAGALALSGVAWAAPQSLTNADLDQVVAGTAGALLDQSVAVSGEGSANSSAGALADLGAAAVNGDENTLTFDPSNSAVAYADSHAINAGDNDYGVALAYDTSLANYSYDPSYSTVNLGDCNEATNFYDNDDVANATGDAIAVGYAEDAATAIGADSLAFEANGDIAVAEDGQGVGYAYDAALNIGDCNVAIEDVSDVTFAQENGVAINEPCDVTLAQEDGTAVYNSGEMAVSDTGIAFANPSDSALAIGDGSIAMEDPSDVAIAADDAVAATAGLDVLLALDGSQAFEDNYNVANTTDTALAIASDGDVAVAEDAGSVAIATPDDTNVAFHGNAAQTTSDGQAVAGDDNTSIYQYVTNGIAAMDSASVNVAENSIEYSDIEDGSAVVIGDGNDICAVLDDADIEVRNLLQADGEPVKSIEQKGGGDITGVIAKNAEVVCSFNSDATEVEVEATIVDSFNVETDAMCIDGQNASSGIALVSALVDPETGINLNVTSASATVPTISAASAPALTAGLSTADTTLTQATINSSNLLTVTF